MIISDCYLEYAKSNFKLDIPNLEIKDNKINCLIGDNGCGKSTFLKQIITDNCQHNIKSKIMMLQKPFIFSGSVEDNFKIVKNMCPESKINIVELMEKLNLWNYKNQRAKSLSGGQKQRLAFALALLCDAELVILDEPFNNTDIKSQQLMINTMKEYQKTYILVSHKISLSKKIGSYFFLMEDGKILFEGDKSTFFDNSKVNDLMEME